MGEPRRPALDAGADTNSARAYYDLGARRLSTDPGLAAAAFYWSARLDPMNADAFYGLRVALLLTDVPRLERYWRADKSILRQPEIKTIDSLYLRALFLNPFLHERFERALVDAVAREMTRRRGEALPEGPHPYVPGEFRQPSLGEQASFAYTAGRFAEALRLYAAAIRQARHKSYYAYMRGRVFFQLGFVDSAVSQLAAALDELRNDDERNLVSVYTSKALLEHSVGMAYERLGNRTAARDAYGRALQEDLAFSPAHVRLASIALEAEDTVTAVNEFTLAVQLQPSDALLRHQFGVALAQANRPAEAEAELLKAVALNPAFADSRLALGVALEAQGRRREAIEAYRAFLERASRDHPRREDAERRIRTLATR